MAKKYLPIKIVQKRDQDTSLTESGGGKPPKWMSRVNIRERSEMIRKTLNDADQALKSRSERLKFIPATIELTLANQATAKTYRSSVREIVNVSNKNNVIGLKKDDTLLIKIEDRVDLNRIRERLSKEKKYLKGLASIVESSAFKPDISVQEKDILKIKLLNYQDLDINRAVHTAFVEICNNLDLTLISTNYTSELVVYQVKYEEKSFAELQQFEAISSIEDMPKFDLPGLSGNYEGDLAIPMIVRDPEVEYPIVGIIDSGIALNNYMQPWIEDEFSPYIDADKDKNHGSTVASILLYGDKLEGNEYTGLKGCRIYDACVLPKSEIIKSVTEADLIRHIREAVENRSDVRIWNMSIGWSVECSPVEISDFGAALDNLSDEHNILICTSVGNCNNFMSSAPPGKIQVSSDSVRAISVGSIAHIRGEFDRSNKDEPSPFTRKGPGPFNMVKPELTHYGGNAGPDDRRNRVSSGVNTIGPNGALSTATGTSFSTPRVTSIIAALDFELNEPFDPKLLKALTIHSAKYPDINLDDNDRLAKMGYGIPSHPNEILYNADNEITLVIRDSIEKGNFIEILDLPYPKEMVDGGFYYGELIVTLVTSSQLDPMQGDEYCQSDVNVMIGTYNEKVQRDGVTIRNEIGRDKDTKNILHHGLYSKRTISQNTTFKSERVLKNYHKKYQPIKKWAVDLSKLTKANKVKYLEYPKLWFLKIEGLFRDQIEQTKGPIKTDFCLIMTIRDPKNQHNVYSSVSQGLDQYNFVQEDIKVKSRVSIRVGSS